MKLVKLWILWLLSSLFFESAMGQFSNTYPRTGAFHWGGGAPAAWYAQYDFIISSSASSSFAQAVKALNPETVIVATRDINGGRQAVDTFYNDWIVQNSKGENVTIYGGGSTLADITRFCPKVGGQQYSDAVIAHMSKLVDLKVFDGIATDGLWGSPWGNATVDIDLDRNGVNDNDEHGRAWVVAEWTVGAGTIVTGLDAALPAGKIFVVNGTTLTPYRSGFNGYVFEYGGAFTGAKWYSGYKTYTELMSTLEEPHAIYIDGCPGWKNVAETVNIRNDFQLMRFILATGLLGDGFVGYQIKYKDHYLLAYYDDFNVNLGMPTSNAYKTLTAGTDAVFVRFFQNGVVVLNVLGSPVTFSDANLRQFAEYKGPYYYFKGGQDPTWNNGSIFSSKSLAGQKLSGGPEYFGDALILVRDPQIVVSDIIIDNSEYYTSPGSSPAVIVGNWTKDSGSGMWSGGSWTWLGAYTSQYSFQGDGSNYAVYRPTISAAGAYELYEWHGTPSNGTAIATNTPHTITVDGSQIAKYNIDQSQNKSQWNSLGLYYFMKGADVTVKISNKANGLVIADAIKLVFKSKDLDNVPPLNPTGLRLEEATGNSLRLGWNAPGAASDGDTVMFYRISRNSQSIGVSYKPLFTDMDLSENTSYSYEIIGYDNSGNACNTSLVGTYSTTVDVRGPVISEISVDGLVTIEVLFDEPLDVTTAENITNYQIEGSDIAETINVTAAVYDPASHKVVLTTSAHTPGKTYVLSVHNVKDLSVAGNMANMQSSYVIIPDPILITVAADNGYEIYVNGTFVGSGNIWSTGTRFEVEPNLGKNVVAIKGIDTGGLGGMLAEVEFMGNHFTSNESWKVSSVEQAGWESVLFNDIGWDMATSYGLHGTAQPWASYRDVANISTTDNVRWIWSSDAENDDVVYFRFTLQTESDLTPPTAPQGIQVISE